MADRNNVIVAGLGAAGSATAYHLAKRGLRVLGLDRFAPGHTHGSSHGDSRIIRELYFEHALYVPLVQRAYDLWTELEAESGFSLLDIIGGVMCGTPAGRVVGGARASATLHKLPFEMLSAEELHRRVPPFELPEHFLAVWDARAGYLRPEAAIRAHLMMAERHGATLAFDEPLVSWSADGDGVSVTTPTNRYRADHLVLAVGAWAGQVAPELQLPLVVERQVLVWFDPPSTPDPFARGRFPIYICEPEVGRTMYGFPRLPEGVKAAIFHEGATVPDPDAPRQPAGPQDIAALREVLAQVLPSLATAPVRSSIPCLFTNTPDTRFVIGPHPAHPQVLLCSSCSGHGFKFSSAVGEVNADLITGRPTVMDLAPFSLGRFATAGAT
jgi:sarcosine oxidase